MHKMRFVAAVLAAGLWAAVACGQTAPVNLQQALDKPFDLVLDDVPISELFARLQARTGVKFIIEDSTLACLPYRDQTRVSVKLKNVMLRKDLSRLLAPQALQWVIENDSVRIVPNEALARMCRSATYDELQILVKLYGERLQGPEQGSAVEQLRKVTGSKDLDVVFQVSADKTAAIARADRALPGTAAQWLDALCQGQPWTWYLYGDEIIVVERKAQINRQLQQQVSLRYQNEKLVTVLLDLSRKARVTLSMDPGVLKYVPSEVATNFNLIMADATIAQALEVIRGATGLEILRTDDGLRVMVSEDLKKQEERAPQRKPSAFMVRMNMPGPDGTNVEVFFRSDDLPEEFVEQVLAEKAKLMAKYGTKKTTTQPAEGDVEH